MNNKITREDAILELATYGIGDHYIYLIDLFPMIEMIWSDGQTQPIEFAVLDHYLEQRLASLDQEAGYSVISREQAQSFIQRYLSRDTPPDPILMRNVRRLIVPIRLSSSDPEANRVIWEFIISGCLDVAASAITQYPYPLTQRLDDQEKRCLFEIIESLDYRSSSIEITAIDAAD